MYIFDKSSLAVCMYFLNVFVVLILTLFWPVGGQFAFLQVFHCYFYTTQRFCFKLPPDFVQNLVLDVF